MILTFDEAAHQYFADGEPVPNVTRVLSSLTDYSHIPEDTLVRAQEEGKAVHRMVELDCKGQLASVPYWMQGQYRAWAQFRTDAGFEPILSEHRVFHATLRYAGTLDLLGEARHLKNAKGICLIDVKRSFYAGPVIGLQTAAYAEALRTDKAMPRVDHRFALRLDADGKYRLQPYPDGSDAAVFIAQLTTYRWKEKHGRH